MCGAARQRGKDMDSTGTKYPRTDEVRLALADGAWRVLRHRGSPRPHQSHRNKQHEKVHQLLLAMMADGRKYAYDESFFFRYGSSSWGRCSLVGGVQRPMATPAGLHLVHVVVEAFADRGID